MSADQIVRNAQWREEATSLSDVLLALHNTLQVVANSRGVNQDPVILSTYRALSLATAEPLIEMSDEGEMHPEDVVYVLIAGALFAHTRYTLRLQELAKLKEDNG